ncbi:hypothetical protein [Pseudomonas sp. PB103]|uniref:hypothetical protein n=1 Tax=Pseudomonas sp. PB103 TaxID=2494698 RepID=UPI002114D4D9|nr:hypothetical protein [Pseudomonas sp. PB103]
MLAQIGHAAETVMVGNTTGQSRVAQGPADVGVDMGACRFSMPLLQDQWLQFNAPDLIFIASRQRPDPSSAPRLWQAPTSSGYEWNFATSANLTQPWFGMMCENLGSFSSLTTQLPADDTIELQLLREANDRKCPATLTENGWRPTALAGDPQTYAFESLQGAKSSGFIIGYHPPHQPQFSRIAFCLMQGEQVLIGAAESGSATPLAISAKGFEQIKTAVRSIAFE